MSPNRMQPATTTPPAIPPTLQHPPTSSPSQPAMTQCQSNTQRNPTTTQPCQQQLHRNLYSNHNHHTRQQLTNWLMAAWKSKPPATTIPPPTQNPVIPAPALQQQLLQPTVINEAWGGAVHTTKQSHIFHVLSKNVNTLSATDDFADWQGAAQACADYEVTVACFQETNLQWFPPLFQ